MKKANTLGLAGLVLSLFLGASTQSYAQEAESLSIEAAVDLALKNNLSIQTPQLDTMGKKRKLDTAWNVFIPTVDVNGSLIRMNTERTASGLAPDPSSALGPAFERVIPYSADIPQWGLAASVSANLTLNIALFEAVGNLRLDYEAGLLSYEKAKAQLERDVRKSFYQILLLKENILLMEENLAASERRARVASENYQAGLAPELTVLQAQVASANIKPAIDELRNALDSSLAAFAMNLGLPQGTKLDLLDVELPDFVDLDMDKLISQAVSSKPEILELKQSLLLLESAKKLSFYQTYTPTLSLGWNADPTFQGDPWKDSWTMDDGWKQSSGMFRATIAYRLNGLLPFSREAQGLVDLDENLKNLNIGLAQAVRGTEVEIYSTLLKLEKSRRNVDALKLNVNLAERTYKLTEESYKAGIKDLLEVQNFELELRRAQLEVIKEKFNYMTGLLDLEYAIGVPFGTLTRG